MSQEEMYVTPEKKDLRVAADWKSGSYVLFDSCIHYQSGKGTKHKDFDST